MEQPAIAPASTNTSDRPPPPSSSEEAGRPHRCRRVMTPANLRVLAFFLVIAVTLVLTTTVLSKPIERGAVWLRSKGLEGYFVISAVGFVFMMLGGSSHIFDFCCGFVYGNRKGIAVSFLVKLITALAAYVVARTYFQTYLRRHFFNQYLWLEAFELMVEDKPWQSMVLIRFSVLPAAVKNYGCGAMGAPVLPYLSCAVVSFAIFSYLLTDIGSKMTDPSDILRKDALGGPLEVVGIVCILLFIVVSIYYTRKYMAKLMKEQQKGGGGGAAAGSGSTVGRGDRDPELGDARRIAPETVDNSKTREVEMGQGINARGAD